MKMPMVNGYVIQYKICELKDVQGDSHIKA